MSRATTSRPWSSVPSQLRLPKMQLGSSTPCGYLAQASSRVELEGGLRRRRHRQLVVDGIVGVADRRPDHPAIGVDLVLDERIAKIGAGEEAAEFRFRIIDEGRKQQLALVGREDRPVIGDNRREAR